MEKHFEEVLSELQEDESMAKFCVEYETLYSAYQESQENERQLKKDIKNALDLSHQKEQQARETIQSLKLEIASLSKLSDQDAHLTKYHEYSESHVEHEDAESQDSEEDHENDLIVLQEHGEDDDSIKGDHTVNFKVLGVTYKSRQKYIECAKNLIANGKEVPAHLEIEPHNPVDPGGIAVIFDTGPENFGQQCVGYIPKELKKFVSPLLITGKIISVKIQHIKLRLGFNPMGLYILLRVTREGRWPNYVVMKSLYAR